MHAFLIVGTDEKSVDLEIEKLKNEYSNQTFLYDLTKIDQVRQLTHFVSLGFDQKVAIVIYNIDQASVEAQNAFLKPLEEPQKNVFYFLTAQSAEAVIPTILSRVNIIQTQNYAEEKLEAASSFSSFFNLGVGQQLEAISKLKNRVDALSFIKSLILNLHARLTESKEIEEILQSADQTRIALEQNGNIQLQLTRFVISLNT